MTDRYRCLDCGHEFCVPMRWVAAQTEWVCSGCGSPALCRVRSLWRTLRDAFIVTNAA